MLSDLPTIWTIGAAASALFWWEPFAVDLSVHRGDRSKLSAAISAYVICVLLWPVLTALICIDLARDRLGGRRTPL